MSPSTPKREDFPPGLDGLKAYKRAIGERVDPEGPWDPAKWDGAPGQHSPPPRPVGKVKLAGEALLAEVYLVAGPPPSDLRARWVSQVPGAQALNQFVRGLHPMELQQVLPSIASGEGVVLAAQAAGGPMLPEGRPAALLDPGSAGGRWTLTLSEDGAPDGVHATGERRHLALLARLYADTVLGSLGPRAQGAPWVERVRAARDALRSEAGGNFEGVRP